MKQMFRSIVFLALAAVAMSGYAQVYPYTTPVYQPNAIAPSVTITASTSSVVPIVFQANNLATVAVRVTGTCQSLTAAVQGTNDGVNWTTLNNHTVGTGTAGFGTAISSVTAASFIRNSAAGLTQERINVTNFAASGTGCTFTMTGSEAGAGGLE
jgi:hypothetical protein